MIPTRRFGKTGVKVSALGFGGHHIGDAGDEEAAIGPHATLAEGPEPMARRPSHMAVRPVVSDTREALGLLRIHDIYLGVK